MDSIRTHGVLSASLNGQANKNEAVRYKVKDNTVFNGDCGLHAVVTAIGLYGVSLSDLRKTMLEITKPHYLLDGVRLEHGGVLARQDLSLLQNIYQEIFGEFEHFKKFFDNKLINK